jgi:starvation-inducible DNA-binding protein
MTNAPVIAALKQVLADSYALYLKTQNFHWNVTGPNFSSLHTMFQTQYEELATAIDDVAERIRILGAVAPGGFKAFAGMTSIAEGTGEESAAQMVEALTGDHGLVITALKTALTAAQTAEDEGTVALVSERLAAHEKAQWMLRVSR